jgi:hypothetical protein
MIINNYLINQKYILIKKLAFYIYYIFKKIFFRYYLKLSFK